MSRIWEKFLTPQDSAVLRASGFGSAAGFGSKPALLIIDVSYGYTGEKPEPILESIKKWRGSCGADAWLAVAVIKKIAEAFRNRRLPVIYTTEYSRSDGWDIGSWAWKNPRSTERPDPRFDPNQIIAELAPQPQDLVVLKQKPSGFFGSSLLSYLVLLGCDSVVVTGTATSGCVRATVIDAFSNNLRVSVVEDGCFDRIQASHALSLCDIHAKYGDVVSSNDILTHVATLNDDLFPNLPAAPRQGADDLR